MAIQPIIQQFQDDVNLLIDKYRDQGITLGEVIGALELIKLDVWFDQKEIGDPE